MEQAGALHEGVVDVEERGLAVLPGCNRRGGDSDVLLLGHASSLVSAGLASVPRAPCGPAKRPDRPGLALRRPASTPGAPPGYRGTMPTPAPLPDVVLITKTDCHLCAEARAAVGRVTAALGIGWTEQIRRRRRRVTRALRRGDPGGAGGRSPAGFLENRRNAAGADPAAGPGPAALTGACFDA